MGGLKPWLMARWKAHVEFLISVIELVFYLLQLRCYKAKCVCSHISKTICHISQNFLYMLAVAMARFPSHDCATCNVFLVLWMTSYLPIMDHTARG